LAKILSYNLRTAVIIKGFNDIEFMLAEINESLKDIKLTIAQK
jgi:hypothetical protein